MDFNIVISKAAAIRNDAYRIRVAVFVNEQGFRDVPDEIDDYAYHVAVYDGDKVIGCGRFFAEGNPYEYHIGRIAVLPEYRSKNAGTLIMRKIEEFLKENGAKKAVLSAQRRALSFYEKIGYTIVGDEFLEQGYPHINMKKDL